MDDGRYCGDHASADGLAGLPSLRCVCVAVLRRGIRMIEILICAVPIAALSTVGLLFWGALIDARQQASIIREPWKRARQRAPIGKGSLEA